MRTFLFVIGFVGAGLVGAAAGRVLLPSGPPATIDGGRSARLESRIRDLETEVAGLSDELRRDRLARSSSGPAAAPGQGPARVPGGALPGSSGPGAGAPREAASPGQGKSSAAEAVPRKDIEDAVREVIEEKARAAREEKKRQAEAMQAEKDDIFLTKLQEALDLDDYQKEELSKHLRRRREALAVYKRKLTQAGPNASSTERTAIRQELLDFVARQDEELKALLGIDKFDRLMRITGGSKRRGDASRGR